jgi:hypothetical protein
MADSIYLIGTSTSYEYVKETLGQLLVIRAVVLIQTLNLIFLVMQYILVLECSLPMFPKQLSHACTPCA